MIPSARITLSGAFALMLLSLLPRAVSPAHAFLFSEITLNSSTVQVVHNAPSNTDVLNLSLNVTNKGDSGTGDCNGELNDLLETGVHVSVSKFTCTTYGIICLAIGCPAFDFDAQVNYVEHEIGFTASYGTSFGPNAFGNVSSKIVPITTAANTCGTWTINLQATGQNLSGITGAPVSLFLNDADNDGNGFSSSACFTVNANVGNGITKPHHGVHSVRH